MPSIDIVIVSFRSGAALAECLRSLREHEPAARVHVVDNASGDGTVDRIRKQFPEVDLVPLDTNVGFGAATNVVARQSSADYVLALNPDTRFQEPILDRLTTLMEEHPRIGICGCRLEREDGTLDHAAKRSFPTPLSALGHFTGLARVAPRLGGYTAPHVEKGQVDAVNGAFMLIRRTALQELGGFDEGYWMYMEDLDLCYRFATAGWGCWYEPSVGVVHKKGGAAARSTSARLTFAFHYGMLRFYRKHYARSHSAAVNALVYVGLSAKLAFALARTPLARAR